MFLFLFAKVCMLVMFLYISSPYIMSWFIWMVTPTHYLSHVLVLLSCSVIMFLSDMTGRAPLYKKYMMDLFHSILFVNLSFWKLWVVLLRKIHSLLSCPSPCSVSRAFVFFSSPVPRELVSHIKKDGSVLARIGALREVMIFSLARFPLFLWFHGNTLHLLAV